MRTAVVALAVLALPIVTASPAQAQTLADRETARGLMEDGDAKREAKDHRGALKAYEAADAIMHVPTTGLEVARMQAALGMLLEARETLLRVGRIPAKPGEPAPFVAARKGAEQLSNELAKRIPSVVLQITGLEPGQTPSVTIDDEPLPPALLGVPRKVNPGAHVIVAKHGTMEQREDIAIGEGETKTVSLRLEPGEPGDDASSPGSVTPTSDGPEPAGRTGSTPAKILMYGGFGVGVIGLGVGAVTGLTSWLNVKDIKDDCEGTICPESRRQDLESARSLGNVSTIAFIAGGAGVAAGVLGLVLNSSSNTEPKHAARFRTIVSPSYVGLAGVF